MWAPTKEELEKIIENHQHWLNADCGGWGSMRADLCGADLYGADLYGANLYGANLRGANLNGAKNIPFIPMACPDSGAFIGWKKAKSSKEERPDWCIIKLEIPSDARRSSATGRKCRCDKAVVLAIESLDVTTIYDHAYSDRDPDFEYKVGETVSVDNFDEDRFNECSTGIHFFINRQEAVDYRF